MSDDNLDPDTDALSLTPEEEIRRLREALEAKTLLAEEHRDRYLRGAAEFDNARKRAAREREEYTRYANEALLREILPVLDNFDGRSVPPQGLRRPSRRVDLISATPARAGGSVTSFTSVGQPFDPERHEAIARVPAQGRPEGTVVDETARGYLLNGRVLRPAMVTVASSPDSS
jgi:molecular chaperone GrpE